MLRREPRHISRPAPGDGEELTDMLKEMFHEMDDVGLKPVTVYHNLRCSMGCSKGVE